MAKFHDEKSVNAPIRKIAKGCRDLRVAVAFWGADGAKTLSLKGARNGRIICNLESGACNPKEIRKLRRASKKFKMKSHPRLHAKIYWSPQAAVIGSSNVSANGLVVGAAEAKGWREANLWVDQADLLRDVGKRFNDLWKEAKPITDQGLKDAEIKWKERAKETKILSIENKTLLKAFVEDPAAFRDQKIFLAMYGEDVSEEAAAAERKWKSLKSTERFVDGLVVRSSGMAAYENWRKMPAGAWLIDCSYMDQKRPRYEGIFRVWERGVVKLSESNVQFAYRTRSVLVGSRSFRLSNDEKRAIEKHGKRLFRATRRRPGLLLELEAVARICGLSRNAASRRR
ncbi:phospholipase D family protein [Bradyrhizobium sp. INPA03-11B]|uniref:phospholipase D family protein n=1 Tax=Bradyrhizobium sp. INPA03-11B TaxID=418598 RepID=UPI00338F0FD7